MTSKRVWEYKIPRVGIMGLWSAQCKVETIRGGMNIGKLQHLQPLSLGGASLQMGGFEAAPYIIYLSG